MKIAVPDGAPSGSADVRPKHSDVRRLRPLALLGVLLSISLRAWALQLSPTYQVFNAKPGQTVKGEMKVTNEDTEAITLTPTTKEWFQLNVNSGFSVDKWLRFDDTNEFTLQPGESRMVSYRLTPPAKAKGELCGAISLVSKPKADMITLQFTVVQYLGVIGTEKLTPKVESLAIQLSSNTEVGVLMRNDGNVHLRPNGYIYVDDLNGKRVLSVQISIGQPCFPGENTVYSSVVKGFRLPPGQYRARIELSDVDRPIKYPVVTKKFLVTAEGKVEAR